MRAVQFSRFGDPTVLELVELPDPHPGPGEVRIRVAAAGMNASDWKKRQGLMDPELPQTAGYEASGTVDEVGDGVTDTAVGDRVFGASPYGAAQAGYAVLAYWAPLPAGLSDTEAAALPAAAETAARALDQLSVSEGDVLLINGASGSVGKRRRTARGLPRHHGHRHGKRRIAGPRGLAGRHRYHLRRGDVRSAPAPPHRRGSTSRSMSPATASFPSSSPSRGTPRT